ncbi:MAG: Prolipoprotein diacylglyceryl transferase [Firmicutes bacterium]|nr:Prolipoprotein diacylglyceryl transferase [Bacillota bacterium]
MIDPEAFRESVVSFYFEAALLGLGLSLGLLVTLRLIKGAGLVDGGCRTDFWRLADLCAPGFALVQTIWSLGGFFRQAGYGIESNVPWAVLFEGIPRHPLFLYYFVLNLVLFFFLLHVGKREKVPGAVFLRYIIWYFGGRYWIEGVVAEPLLWWRFKAGQLISLFLLHGGLIVLWQRRRRLKKTEGGERGCVT